MAESGHGDDGRPRGELAIRTLAMPADANPAGDIFGGWLMSQMDVAGGVTAAARARGRVATVAVQAMEFHRPVLIGDVLCCYVEIEKIGRTSITIRVEAWVQRGSDPDRLIKVTEGVFTFVALDKQGRPRPVLPQATSSPT
jgi:acyl-CoA thioesterase YciA